jgi:cytochrome P450
MDLGWQLSMLPYGDTWRRSRKLLRAHVHPGALQKHTSTQLHLARSFARDILRSDQDGGLLRYMIHANIGQTIVKMVYGVDTTDNNNEFISLAERVMGYINESVLPGRFLVEFLPVCKYFIRRCMEIVNHGVEQ